MTDKQMRRLNRLELLDIILELQKKLKSIEEQNQILQKQLDARKVDNQNIGSIADAVIYMSGIFELAQKTADEYVESVKLSQSTAERQSAELIENAKIEAKRFIDEAKEQSNIIRKNNDIEIEKKWKEFFEKTQEGEGVQDEEFKN